MKRVFLFLLLGGFGLTACEHLPLDRILDRDNEPSDEQQEAQQRLRRMRAAIMELVGEARCEDAEQCRFVGLGAKPCGGPWEYLVYSIAQTDPDDLIAHVREYNQFERQINEHFGRDSDCSMPPQPELECIEGRCVDLNRPRPPVPDQPNVVNMEIMVLVLSRSYWI